MNKYIQVINQVETSRIRVERDDNNDEIIILGGYTMPDDIVMNRIMYPREEIESSYRGLEGIPAPIGHPHDSDGNYVSASSEIGVNRFQHGAFVGRVERHENRIYIETRLNKRKAAETEQGKRLLRIVQDLMDGLADEPLHTSTGVYLNAQKLPQPRICDRGKEYDQIARGLVFDHNAILLDEEGAATPTDGVGMLVNKDKGNLQVMRVNCAEFAQGGVNGYDTDKVTLGYEMALKDKLQGFLKANNVDVAENATDEQLLEHLSAMKVNAEIEPEKVDFEQLAINAAVEANKELSGKIDSIVARFNAMDEDEKAALMKKLKDNGFEDDKLEGMSMDDMKKEVAKLSANSKADYSKPGEYQANAKSESFTTNLEDW